MLSMAAASASAPRRTGGALLVIAASVAALLSGAPAAAADDLPSWSDVQDARADEAQTRALVTRIESALAAAQSRSLETSQAALTAASAATAARADADAATARADEIEAASAAATQSLDAARGGLGGFASRLYRAQTDGPLVARLLTATDPDSLLERLGLLEKLSGTWTTIARGAERTALTAQSLSARAAEAETARVAAADAAARTAAEAQSAADADARRVADAQAQADTLYAQLATLKNTSADIERRYRLGQQVAAQPAANAPGAAGSGGVGSGGSGSGSGSGSGGSGSGSSGEPGSMPTYGVSVDPAGAKAYARGAIGRFGWAGDQFSCLELLWNRESGWRANALNPSSGAYGIPQALPASKMAAAGADWRTNGNTQVDWGLSYIRSRYGSPCGAWDHSQRTGWY